MKKKRLINRPMKIDSLDFDDLNEDIDPYWEHRAEALQARKWRQLKNSLKGNVRRFS